MHIKKPKSLYEIGAEVEPAGFLNVETPSSILARLNKIHAVAMTLDMDIKREKAKFKQEELMAWNNFLGAWNAFYKDGSESYWARMWGAMGDRAVEYEAEMAKWYLWAKTRIQVSGVDPTNDWKFGKAVPYVIGGAIIVGGLWWGMKYLKEGPTMTIGNGGEED